MITNEVHINKDYYSGDAWKYSYINRGIEKAITMIEEGKTFAVDLYDRDTSERPVRMSFVISPSTQEILFETPQRVGEYPILLHAYDFLHKLAQRTQLNWLSEKNTQEKYYEKGEGFTALELNREENLSRIRIPLTVDPDDINLLVFHRQDKDIDTYGATQTYKQGLRETYPIQGNQEIPFPAVALLLAIDVQAELPYKQPEKRTALFRTAIRSDHQPRNFNSIHERRFKFTNFPVERVSEEVQ